MQGTLERLQARKQDESGFTLIELLIVIVILGILAAIVVFAVQNLQGTSAKGACSSDVQTVDHAVQAYYAEKNTYPTSVNTLLTGSNPLLHNNPVNGTHYQIELDTNVVKGGTAAAPTFTSSSTSPTGLNGSPVSGQIDVLYTNSSGTWTAAAAFAPTSSSTTNSAAAAACTNVS